jgi:MinD-like ATPase involved in chromosome partitioning or flagellar assembly
VADFAGSSSSDKDPYGGLLPDRGRRIVVAGAAGGVGATEVAIGLVTCLGRGGGQAVLVDGDDVGPSIVQRLGLDIHPNLRTAIDVVRDRVGQLEDVLVTAPNREFEVLGGIANRRDWFELRPADVTAVVLELANRRRYVIVNVSSRLEDLPAIGGPPRYGVTRSMLALAEVVVLVAAATPVGVSRVLDWIAEAQPLIESTHLIIVFNAYRGGPFIAAEIEEELRAVYQPRSVAFVPFDKTLAQATWQGVLPGRGPFLKGMDHLGSLIAPSRRRSRSRRTG